jgi:autotransporter-associated beta strand protein
LTRWFSTPNLTTNLYVSWVMNVQTSGSAQYAGLEIVGGAGGTTPLFRAGLTPGSANAGIQSLLHGGNPSSNSAVAVEAGVDYTFVLKYVKQTKAVYLLAYTTNDVIQPAATDEPTTNNWHAQFRMNDVISTNFFGLRLVAGGATGPGTVKWDEVRVANNWTNLFDVGRQPVWDGDANQGLWFKAENWVGDQLPRMDVEVTVFYEEMGRAVGEANNVGRINFNGNAGNHYPVLGLRFDYRQTNGVYIYGNGNSTVMELSHQGIEVQAGASGQTSRGTNTLAIDELQLLTDQPWTSASTNAFTFFTQISSTGNVTKSGSGRFHIVGRGSKSGTENTFSGVMTVQDGPLSIEGFRSLGSISGRTVVASGGVLELRPTAATIFTNEPLTLSGMGMTNEGALYNLAAFSNRWTGPITVADYARIGASTNSTLTLAGGVNGVDGQQDLYLGGLGPIFVINTGLGSNLRHLIKDNANTVTLSAASSWIGCTFLSNGMLRATLAESTSAGTSFLVSTGGVFNLNNYNQIIGSLQDGNEDPAGRAGEVWLGTANLTVGDNGSNTTWHGVISGTGGLNKRGTGTMTMAGTNTYSGTTTVSNGTLIVSGASPYSAHTTHPGGTLMGDGPVGDLTIGGTVDPGNYLGLVDTLESGPIQLVAGGILKVDMAAASGVAGTAWDLINSYGGITVQANGTFTIRPQGNPTGFDSSLSYAWKVMGGVSSVAGFHVSKFSVDPSGFFPNLSGGQFGVAVDGNDLYLTFTTGGGIPIWDGEGVDSKWDTAANWVGDLVPSIDKTVVFYTGLDSGAVILLNGIRTVGGMRFTDLADESLIFAGTQISMGLNGIGVYADSAGEHTLACLVGLQGAQTWTNDSEAVFTAAAQISGSHPLRKKGLGKMVFSANNAFTGGLFVDEGGLQLNSSTNAMGTGAVQVGTNATLELNGNFLWRPVDLTLYGMGTNGGGAVRQISSGVGEWRGTITAGNDARFSIAAGAFNTYNAISAGANTLYITNFNSFTMISNQFTGTRTTGDGALHKSGPGGLFLRGSTLEGSVVVAQGALRLVENLSDGGGALRLLDNAILSSSNATDRTVSKPVSIEGNVALGALGVYRGPLHLTNTVDLAGAVRGIAVSNLATLGGPIDNGGFIKTAPGTMTVSAVNTYLGNTSIDAGVLVVSGSSAGSAHTVNSGGILRGAGTVGPLSIWGIADPANAANAAGTLTADGPVTLNATGTLKIDMPNAAGAAGTDWDLLVANGTVSVPASGQFVVWVTGAASGFVPGVGQSWRIVDGPAVSGFDADRFIVDTSGFAPEIYGGVFSVSNDVDNGDLYLVFVPSVQDPDYFGVAPDGPTEMQLEFELNDAGQSVVILFNETGVFEAPSGTPPAVGQPFAGGTVVYLGDETPQIHSGLTSCTRYYYKMFSHYDGRYSDGLADDDTTSPPPPPVVREATLIGTNTFTANWDASTGATGYRLDVSTSPYFTAGGAAGAQMAFLGQGFEGGAEDNWAITLGNAYVSSENPTTDHPSAGRIRTGSSSWQRRNGAGTLQLGAASIEGFTSRTVEVRVASISTNGTNGAELTDKVSIFVSLNGAAFSETPDVVISGASRRQRPLAVQRHRRRGDRRGHARQRGLAAGGFQPQQHRHRAHLHPRRRVVHRPQDRDDQQRHLGTVGHRRHQGDGRVHRIELRGRLRGSVRGGSRHQPARGRSGDGHDLLLPRARGKLRRLHQRQFGHRAGRHHDQRAGPGQQPVRVGRHQHQPCGRRVGRSGPRNALLCLSQRNERPARRGRGLDERHEPDELERRLGRARPALLVLGRGREPERRRRLEPLRHRLPHDEHRDERGGHGRRRHQPAVEQGDRDLERRRWRNRLCDLAQPGVRHQHGRLRRHRGGGHADLRRHHGRPGLALLLLDPGHEQHQREHERLGRARRRLPDADRQRGRGDEPGARRPRNDAGGGRGQHGQPSHPRPALDGGPRPAVPGSEHQLHHEQQHRDREGGVQGRGVRLPRARGGAELHQPLPHLQHPGPRPTAAVSVLLRRPDPGQPADHDAVSRERLLRDLLLHERQPGSAGRGQFLQPDGRPPVDRGLEPLDRGRGPRLDGADQRRGRPTGLPRHPVELPDRRRQPRRAGSQRHRLQPRPPHHRHDQQRLDLRRLRRGLPVPRLGQVHDHRNDERRHHRTGIRQGVRRQQPVQHPPSERRKQCRQLLSDERVGNRHQQLVLDGPEVQLHQRHRLCQVLLSRRRHPVSGAGARMGRDWSGLSAITQFTGIELKGGSDSTAGSAARSGTKSASRRSGPN